MISFHENPGKLASLTQKLRWHPVPYGDWMDCITSAILVDQSNRERHHSASLRGVPVDGNTRGEFPRHAEEVPRLWGGKRGVREVWGGQLVALYRHLGINPNGYVYVL